MGARPQNEKCEAFRIGAQCAKWGDMGPEGTHKPHQHIFGEGAPQYLHHFVFWGGGAPKAPTQDIWAKPKYRGIWPNDPKSRKAKLFKIWGIWRGKGNVKNIGQHLEIEESEGFQYFQGFGEGAPQYLHSSNYFGRGRPAPSHHFYLGEGRPALPQWFRFLGARPHA